mgnify:CR=1 FL=1
MNSSSVFFAKNDIRFRKILLFVLPTYLTTLFNTLYTIVDGMFPNMSEQTHWQPLTLYIPL